jgi:hypothetical protein|tara:strand:+ start:192 stop:575 length:384 start_codon:yes stop_codon:yes gene_type:complete
MSILTALISPVASLLEKVVEDKDQRNALAHEIATLATRQSHELMKGQLEVNKVEASSSSVFVAGWRPMVGWISAFALAYSTIISPVLAIWLPVPELDSSLLTTVLLGMLGMGTLRTIEKTQSVARTK